MGYRKALDGDEPAIAVAEPGVARAGVGCPGSFIQSCDNKRSPDALSPPRRYTLKASSERGVIAISFPPR